MAGAAKRSRLSELHRMFTEALIEEIKQSKEDEVPLPAADKSVIAKFLKDNDITADADSEEMQDLRDEFDDELAARREARKKEILNKISGSDSEDLLEGNCLMVSVKTARRLRMLNQKLTGYSINPRSIPKEEREDIAMMMA